MVVDQTYPQDRVQHRQDGNMAVPNGQHIDIETGGKITVNDVDVTPAIAKAMAGSVPGLKIAKGQKTTVTASDTVATGLTTVLIVVACLESAPVLTCAAAQAAIGDQAGAPAAGSILVKTFMPTANNDTTPIPATTFGKVVNWLAIGT